MSVELAWSGWLNMATDEKPGCGYGTSTGGFLRTLPDLMADLFRMATYYLSDQCGYTRVDVHVEEHCAACGGSGTVGRTRTLKLIKCKACKGHGARREILRATWRPYGASGGPFEPRSYVRLTMHEREEAEAV